MVRTIPFVVILAGCFILVTGTCVALRADDGSKMLRGSSEESPLSPAMRTLRRKVRRVLRSYYQKSLNTRDSGPWSLMHATVAFGVDTQVRIGSPRGTPVTAVGWLCYNRNARGHRLFFPVGDHFGIRKGPGEQGHNGQLLAILAQSHVAIDYPIKVAGKNFTVADLVKYEQQTCVAGTELTFKLIGLSHYLDLDARWQSRNGQQWSISRLMHEELAQPIQGATCGGSHRLMGLSCAVRKRARQGAPMVGEYRRALVFVRDYHKYTFRLQNRDGSFSTDWFRGRGNKSDPARKLTTTGHILEWLVFSLPSDELRSPPTVRAVNFLSNLLLNGRDEHWHIGSLGHALHALVLYDQRVFDGSPADYRQPAPRRRRNRTARLPRGTVRRGQQAEMTPRTV